MVEMIWNSCVNGSHARHVKLSHWTGTVGFCQSFVHTFFSLDMLFSVVIDLCYILVMFLTIQAGERLNIFIYFLKIMTQ